MQPARFVSSNRAWKTSGCNGLRGRGARVQDDGEGLGGIRDERHFDLAANFRSRIGSPATTAPGGQIAFRNNGKVQTAFPLWGRAAASKPHSDFTHGHPS